ncbi:MAG: hypothetical protein H7281_09305 [Bacteriovorax sp.]|nr:hypothetical protein [Bacteriovorax sp.]
MAFLLVRDPLSREHPSIPQPKIKKSEISQLFNNYYLVQIHPDDQREYANKGFTQSGVYEFNTKKLVAPFPYQQRIANSQFHTIHEDVQLFIRRRYLIKNLSDKGISIYENGKEKFSYKVNKFCKRLARDAFIPNSKEYFWIDTTSDAPIPYIDYSSQILLKAKCNKRFLLNYRTGKIEQIENPNVKLIGKNTDFLIYIILMLVVLIVTSLLSLRLKSKFLTYIIVLICCFFVFIITKETGDIAYRSLDEIFLYFFS